MQISSGEKTTEWRNDVWFYNSRLSDPFDKLILYNPISRICCNVLSCDLIVTPKELLQKHPDFNWTDKVYRIKLGAIQWQE